MDSRKRERYDTTLSGTVKHGWSVSLDTPVPRDKGYSCVTRELSVHQETW